MAYQLTGNWHEGLAVDLHTMRSTYMGVDQHGHDTFENIRSEMGELVYRLKYRNDYRAVPKIVDLLLDNITGLEIMDTIVPAPPSKRERPRQPVYAIAMELGRRLGVEVLTDALEKQTGGTELKTIQDPEMRMASLRGSMRFNHDIDLYGKHVLLVDDLYRSGSTLKVATDLLMNQGQASRVYVLTMTKTRSNR